MARVKGGYLGGIYDIPKKQPLDSRMLVTKKVDLINPSTWKTGGSPTGEFGHYNGMIVAVNSDGIYNGVYYLINRNAITEDNYAAYKAALAANESVDNYFSMWMKLGTLEDLAVFVKELSDIKELIGDIPEGKTVVDLIGESTSISGLVPVDNAIIIRDTEDGGKAIGVAISANEGNALAAIENGLFVPTMSAGSGIEIVDNEISVKIADNSHGLVAVENALLIKLATHETDGAMSKEDKVALDTVTEDVKNLKNEVSDLKDGLTWGKW